MLSFARKSGISYNRLTRNFGWRELRNRQPFHRRSCSNFLSPVSATTYAVSVERESQEYDASFSGLPVKLDIKLKKINLKNSLHRRLKEEQNDLEMK